MNDSQVESNRDELSQWYFAALRKHIHDEIASNTTPASLIGMDRQLVEMLVDDARKPRPEEQSSTGFKEAPWRYGWILIAFSALAHVVIFMTRQ